MRTLNARLVMISGAVAARVAYNPQIEISCRPMEKVCRYKTVSALSALWGGRPRLERLDMNYREIVASALGMILVD